MPYQPPREPWRRNVSRPWRWYAGLDDALAELAALDDGDDCDPPSRDIRPWWAASITETSLAREDDRHARLYVLERLHRDADRVEMAISEGRCPERLAALRGGGRPFITSSG